MHLEIQIDSHKLFAILRQRFSQQGFCTADSTQFAGETFYFDHLTIADTTHFKRVFSTFTVYGSSQVSGYKLQLVQPITIFAVALSSLPTNGDPATSFLQVPVTIVLDVSMQEGTDGWALHLDYNEMATTAPDALKPAIKTALSSLPKLPPFDLSFMKQLTEQDFVVAQSFVSCDPQTTRIAIRFEQSGAPPEGATAWALFLSGTIENPPTPSPIWVEPVGTESDGPTGHPIISHGHARPHWETPPPPPNGDWSAFVDFGLIEPRIHKQIAAASSDTLQIRLQTIAVTWRGDGVQAEFRADTPTEPFQAYVGVHVWLTAQLSIDAQGQLKTNGNWDYSVEPGDEGCALLASAGYGLVAGVEVAGALGFGAIVGAIVGAVAGVLATIIDTALSGSPLSLPDCTTDDSAKQFSCTQILPVPTNPLLGKLTVDRLVGLSGGPLLLGSLVPPAGLKPVTITQVDVSDWAWGIQGSCSTSLVIGVRAEIVISATGAPPLHLCASPYEPSRTAIYDFLSGAITVTESPGTSASAVYVEISPGGSSYAFQQYMQHPSSFKLLLHTNVGVRLITLPPIPVLTDANKHALELQLVEATVNCKAEAARWSQLPGFNPIWNVDPGPEREIDMRWWAVAASGLTDGERLAIEEGSGHPLVQAAPNAAGFARVDALTGPGVDIAVARAAGRDGARPSRRARLRAPRRAVTDTAGKATRRVVVTETALSRTARIELSAPCRIVEAGMFDGVPVAFCISEGDTHELYDLSDPFRPALRRRLVVPGLRGVVNWGGYLVLWGSEGLWLVGGAPRYLLRPPSLPQDRIARVTADRQLIVQLADGTELAFDNELHPVSAEPRLRSRDTWPISGWLAHASRVGRTLVWPDGSAVEIWWIGRSTSQG